MCLQDLEYVLVAVDMLPRFYQILRWKKKNFYSRFKQAIQLRFIGISNR